MMDSPRFRYLLLTPTWDHGSPVISYRLQRDGRCETVTVLPRRRVCRGEFDSLRKGLDIWAEDSLGGCAPVADLEPDGTIRYSLPISSHECFGRMLFDRDFMKHLIGQLLVGTRASIDLTRTIVAEISQCDQKRLVDLAVAWDNAVSQMFGRSIPLVLSDEIVLRAFEESVHRATPDTQIRSSIIGMCYRSEYAQDVVLGRSGPLPESKEWTDSPPPMTVPLYHNLDESSGVADRIVHILGADSKFRSDYSNRLLTIAPLVFRASELVHYVLGSLMLTGNHLWLRMAEHCELRTEDWRVLSLSDLAVVRR